MIASQLQPLANHLWQSTLFAVVAGLLTLALSDNRPQARYLLWLVASVKFLVPFSLLVMVGSLFERHHVMATAPSRVPLIIEQISEPFVSRGSPTTVPASQPSVIPFVPILWAIWTIGFVILVVSWWKRWQQIRAALSAASPLHLPIGVEAMSSPAFMEPGVFGVRRPILLLPDGITGHLTPGQLEAILNHELCHIRRRDNLAAALHMVVEALFWFHPLVWWVGARLMDERERACDEEVLQMGSEPEAYAGGILKICELYLDKSSLPCVAGVTRLNLRKRIEEIMANRIGANLSYGKNCYGRARETRSQWPGLWRSDL